MHNRRKSKIHIGIRILLVIVVAFAVFKPISLQLQIRDLQQQCEDLDESIAQKKVVNEDLKEALDEGVTDETIAKIARDVLGYASPGERVFIDSSEQ
ncbi:MAG: septum formation initiator family protein [Eubacteriales bacterium]|nr:septum formation initiator family protein [Eubacteriales bacterium]